jgi:hypothetical protein
MRERKKGTAGAYTGRFDPWAETPLPRDRVVPVAAGKFRLRKIFLLQVPVRAPIYPLRKRGVEQPGSSSGS